MRISHGQAHSGRLPVDPIGHRRGLTSQSATRPSPGQVHQRLYARPRDGQGPEGILTREGRRPPHALGRQPPFARGETVEAQEWGCHRRFPGHIVVDERAEALQTAREWRRRDTIWTDGSRLNSRGVGAACVWQYAGGWAWRRYHLGTNRGVFGTETYAIYQALRHRYTGSATATDRVRTDTIDPSQRFAIAAMDLLPTTR